MINVRNWAFGLGVAALIPVRPHDRPFGPYGIGDANRLADEGGGDGSLHLRGWCCRMGSIAQVRGAVPYISIDVGRSLTGLALAWPLGKSVRVGTCAGLGGRHTSAGGDGPRRTD